MNKLIAIMAMAILFSSVTHAKIIDLDEKNMFGDMLFQDGTLYKVLYYTETYFNGNALKRIVVENTNEITRSDEKIIFLNNEISNLTEKIVKLEEEAEELKNSRDKQIEVVNLLEKQKELAESQLNALINERNELENRITGNIIMSPNSYRIGIVVIIVLISAVVVFKGMEFSKKKKKGEREKKSEEKGEKEESKGEIGIE